MCGAPTTHGAPRVCCLQLVQGARQRAAALAQEAGPAAAGAYHRAVHQLGGAEARLVDWGRSAARPLRLHALPLTTHAPVWAQSLIYSSMLASCLLASWPAGPPQIAPSDTERRPPRHHPPPPWLPLPRAGPCWSVCTTARTQRRRGPERSAPSATWRTCCGRQRSQCCSGRRASLQPPGPPSSQPALQLRPSSLVCSTPGAPSQQRWAGLALADRPACVLPSDCLGRAGIAASASAKMGPQLAARTL
jgi:hypothetical protein